MDDSVMDIDYDTMTTEEIDDIIMRSFLNDDDEDDDDDELLNYLQERPSVVHGGSEAGKGPNKRRDFTAAAERFDRLYLGVDPVFNDKDFRRRFRMSKQLFWKITEDVKSKDDYFKTRCDAVGKAGIHGHMKVIAALRTLAYGSGADSLDEILEISETVTLESVTHFCNAIVDLYESDHLRRPNEEDVQSILSTNSRRGFPGLLGSLDCMHWGWKNCPTEWKGTYQGKEKKPTIVLEAVATQDLKFWHAYAGIPGSLNDINIIDQSPFITDLIRNKVHASFIVNGNVHTKPYVLVDGIYPPWAIFIGSAPDSTDRKLQFFTKMQEAVRKDIERAFGVVQIRFHILVRPSQLWDVNKMINILKTCMILHNMIIDDEKDLEDLPVSDLVLVHGPENGAMPSIQRIDDFDDYSDTFIQRFKDIQCRGTNEALKKDLVEHLWNERALLNQ